MYPQEPPNQHVLPPGWISQWDPNHQQWYFVDTSTGISTWNDPRFNPRFNPQSNRPLFVPGSSANNGHHSTVPDVAPVSVIDPTQAIALELSQTVPSLMGPPTSNSSKTAQDAYKEYLRRIQDVQNSHTRAIRDAQIEHERKIRDADLQRNNDKMNTFTNSFGLIGSIKGLFTAGTRQYSLEKNYKHRLDNAKLDYNKHVDYAHRQLNDGVEQANRVYQDALSRS